MDGDLAIRTRDLTRRYGSTVGIDGLDMDVLPGEIFGFLGPNGAGKTTTIRLLLDLIRPSRGNAWIFGHPVKDSDVRARVGYLPGELALDGRMTGKETLDFLSSLNGAGGPVPPPRDSLCRRLGLRDKDLGRKVREYSRGMKQKLGLVSAFEHGPPLLILDEPTTGLDPLVREEIFGLMAEAKNQGSTVFHSSHVLSEVDRTCDRVGILREGVLVALLTVEEARKASSRRMVVDFGGDPPVTALEKAGAKILSREGGRMILSVPGDPGALLALLASHPVEHLSFPEPSLDEAFAAFYRPSAASHGNRS